MGKKLIEKLNPLIFLFDSILFVSIGITSLISFLMVMIASQINPTKVGGIFIELPNVTLQ